MSESPKTKILICGILPPPNFGHSVMYRTLMDSSFPDEFDVTFLDMKFWTYGKHKKVTIDKLLKLIKYYFQFIWLLIVRRPQYVLYNMSFYSMPFLKDFLFCLTGKIFGAKIVIHDFGQYIKELHDNGSGFTCWILKQYMKITTASIIMGEQTRSKYDGFLDQKRLFIAPGCVEDTWDLLGGIRVPESKPDYINILYFSFMSELKGVYVAFEAARTLCVQRKDVGFTFAGPLENDQVEQALENLKHEFPDRIHYLGYVEGAEERTKVFREADIFIFPTLRDVFGLVLLHALAEGIPVVASREGNVPEIIREGKNGCLFEKGDADALTEAVGRLIENDSLRRSMTEANRQRFVEHYALEHYGRYMKNAFEGIKGLD